MQTHRRTHRRTHKRTHMRTLLRTRKRTHQRTHNGMLKRTLERTQKKSHDRLVLFAGVLRGRCKLQCYLQGVQDSALKTPAKSTAIYSGPRKTPANSNHIRPNSLKAPVNTKAKRGDGTTTESHTHEIQAENSRFRGRAGQHSLPPTSDFAHAAGPVI